ncbi:molybdenum cofactor guanylyltransferase [Sphingobium aquiterrae]|uniref:molybdenum cofactor guanylyltransferase n=1 Tax=Sphingobium aquiterrae TaxID=2038656 RepID=UPI00301AA2AB
MILGAVLAGGQSRRFGSDKAVALWRGTALVEHACATVARVADHVVVCGAAHAPFQPLPDRPEGARGPLAGLNAALHWGRAQGYEAVLSLGCDTPLVPADILCRLIAAEGPAFLDACPIIGYWPAALADALDHFLASDPRCSMKGWAASVGAQVLDSPPIANVNTPEDLAALG